MLAVKSNLYKRIDAFHELEGKNEVVFCKNCGKKIWKYWRERKGINSDFVEMDKCANCFFKRT